MQNTSLRPKMGHFASSYLSSSLLTASTIFLVDEWVEMGGKVFGGSWSDRNSCSMWQEQCSMLCTQEL